MLGGTLCLGLCCGNQGWPPCRSDWCNASSCFWEELTRLCRRCAPRGWGHRHLARTQRGHALPAHLLRKICTGILSLWQTTEVSCLGCHTPGGRMSRFQLVLLKINHEVLKEMTSRTKQTPFNPRSYLWLQWRLLFVSSKASVLQQREMAVPALCKLSARFRKSPFFAGLYTLWTVQEVRAPRRYGRAAPSSSVTWDAASFGFMSDPPNQIPFHQDISFGIALEWPCCSFFFVCTE